MSTATADPQVATEEEVETADRAAVVGRVEEIIQEFPEAERPNLPEQIRLAARTKAEAAKPKPSAEEKARKQALSDRKLLATELLVKLPADECAVAVEEIKAAFPAPVEEVAHDDLELPTAHYAIENPRPPVLGFWGDWLVPGEASGLVARGGHGKTEYTRNMMLQSARGKGDFCGKDFYAGPVSWLYYTREGNGGWWLDRLRRTAEALGIGDEALDRIVPVNWAEDCGLSLTTPEDVNQMRRHLERMRSDHGDGPLAVAFDPFTDFKAGSDQDDEAVQSAFASIKALCSEFRVAAWVPHHTSQNGEGLDAARGSTKYEGTVAALLHMTAPGTDASGKKVPKTVRKLHVEKNRYGPKSTHWLDFNEDTNVYTERARPGAPSAAVEAMRKAGDAGISRPDIAKDRDISETAAEEAVATLVEEGKAVVIDPDARPRRYRLTELPI